MTLQELVNYCKTKSAWHREEFRRLNGRLNFGMADVNDAKAGVYREIGLRLATILESDHEDT